MSKTALMCLLIGLLLFSCKKDKTQAVCEGVTMEGEKSRFVGTWRWYTTTIEQWFDIGPSNYLEYTPQNQGFEYYLTISGNGEFRGYRNDSLKISFLLTDIEFENFQNSSTYAVEFINDCGNNTTTLYQYAWNSTNDSIFSLQYPLDFDDQQNHLRSKINYFVKE